MNKNNKDAIVNNTNDSNENENDNETVAEVDARMKAVDKAKEISSDAKGPVIVERSDGAVRMEFRHGEIYRYRFDTNRRAA